MSNFIVKSIPIVTAIVGLGTGYTFFRPLVLEQLERDGALNPQLEAQLKQLENNPIKELGGADAEPELTTSKAADDRKPQE